MDRLRALVVDDSGTARRLIGGVLDEHPAVEVVGLAASGRDAVEMALSLRPDVVFVDQEMPGLTGIETARILAEQVPGAACLILSGVDPRRRQLMGPALAAGARGWIPKSSSLPELRRTLHGEVELLSRRREGDETPRRRRQSPRPDVVAIGASTGGPAALSALLPRLPRKLGVPVVVVQHMPPKFTTLLAERLDSRCPWPVREASQGALLAPDAVWLAPGGLHLTVEGGPGAYRARLTEAPPVHGCRPAVDVLFASLSREDAGTVLGLVLTGMGSDGAAGAVQLRSWGARVLAQDEASSVVWGMPAAVVKAGAADAVVSLLELPQAIRGELGLGILEVR